MRTATVVSVRFGITSAVSNRVKFDDLFYFLAHQQREKCPEGRAIKFVCLACVFHS